jgi:hypothetical protein
MAPLTPITKSRLYPLAHKGKTTYPPKSQPPRKGRGRRDVDKPSRKRSRWASFWYQGSFAVVLIVLALLLFMSGYGIGDQSVSRGLVGRVNIVLLAATYTAVVSIHALILVGYILERWKRVLRTGWRRWGKEHSRYYRIRNYAWANLRGYSTLHLKYGKMNLSSCIWSQTEPAAESYRH